MDVDEPVDHVPVSWDVLPTRPRWDVWRSPSRPQPLIADRRKRHAAKAAGAVVGALGVVGVVAYGFQWQVMHVTAMQQMSHEASVAVGYQCPTDGLQHAVDQAQKRYPGPYALIALVDGAVVATSSDASRPAADIGFLEAALDQVNGKGEFSDSYTSLSSAYVYEVTTEDCGPNGQAVIVDVVDVTADRNRMTLGYLAYSLIGLGMAAAAGTVAYRRAGPSEEPDPA